MVERRKIDDEPIQVIIHIYIHGNVTRKLPA
jgi:hypothetical protein